MRRRDGAAGGPVFESYVNRLRGLGFPCEMENVFTSGMATGMYLMEKYPGVPPVATSTTPTPSGSGFSPILPTRCV